jgi:hypothetical protein
VTQLIRLVTRLARDAGVKPTLTQARVVQVLNHHIDPRTLEVAELAFSVFDVSAAIVANGRECVRGQFVQ